MECAGPVDLPPATRGGGAPLLLHTRRPLLPSTPSAAAAASAASAAYQLHCNMFAFLTKLQPSQSFQDRYSLPSIDFVL